jgi:hypothetical protein
VAGIASLGFDIDCAGLKLKELDLETTIQSENHVVIHRPNLYKPKFMRQKTMLDVDIAPLCQTLNLFIKASSKKIMAFIRMWHGKAPLARKNLTPEPELALPVVISPDASQVISF